MSDASLVEGDAGQSFFVLDVFLSEPTTVNVTVHLATGDGTATLADGDYESLAVDVTFLPGAVGPATFSVPVNGDTVVESDETVAFELSNATNATIADGTGGGTIGNDDEAPVVPALSVSDASLVEGDSGQSILLAEVSLSEPTTVNVSVEFATGDGTATLADGDYESLAITLTFLPGAVGPAMLSVPVNGDTVVEPDETITLALSNATNATIADGTGVGTIVNDDAVVDLDETAVSVAEGDSGTTGAVITGVLSSPLATDLDLPATAAAGTATEGTDYQPPQGATLQIPAGSTSGTLSVPVVGDTDVEPDETFTVSFDLPEPMPFRPAGFASAVTVGGTLTAEVTIVDDDVLGPPTTATTSTIPSSTTTEPAATGPATSSTTTTATADGTTSTTTTVPSGTLPATR